MHRWKEYVDKYVNDNCTSIYILNQMEKKLRLADYVRKETNDSYVDILDKDLLDKELISFLKRFYAQRYSVNKCDNMDALSELEELTSTEERLAFSERKSYENFKSGINYGVFFLDDSSWKGIRFTAKEIVLSMDGKIPCNVIMMY